MVYLCLYLVACLGFSPSEQSGAMTIPADSPLHINFSSLGVRGRDIGTNTVLELGKVQTPQIPGFEGQASVPYPADGP